MQHSWERSETEVIFLSKMHEGKIPFEIITLKSILKIYMLTR
jgi:hypothetical protein